jgi:hypothetical protein
MITEVVMQRELFGFNIAQKSKTEFFSATDLQKAGNDFRRKNNLYDFNLSQFLKLPSTKEFIKELESKFETKVVISGKGRSAGTWVHPLLFIDIALSISPKLKIEVYEWLHDTLLKNRNNSGDSYKEMASALWQRHTNHREFPTFIINVADYIKNQIGINDWNEATKEQLELRDKIHVAIKLYCNVLTNPKEAVRLGVAEYVKPQLKF